MASEEHLKILKQGVEQWNKWRLENAMPDLSDAALNGAHLAGFDLRGANLKGAYLERAGLSSASLNVNSGKNYM